jgi:hypothetical protein
MELARRMDICVAIRVCILSPRASTAVSGRRGERQAPTVSIVVPAYNAEVKIDDCVRSLLQLKEPSGGVETIVVDNHSTDATLRRPKFWKTKEMREWSSLGSIPLEVLPIKSHAPRGRIVESNDQFYQGCLSGAVLADEG